MKVIFFKIKFQKFKKLIMKGMNKNVFVPN